MTASLLFNCRTIKLDIVSYLMQPQKLTISLTNFILMFLLIFIQAPIVADHGGFTATLSATDVVDDGTNSIEVESREAGTSFINAHDVNIQVVVRFDKPIKKSELTSADFETYLFNQYDEIVDATLPSTNPIPDDEIVDATPPSTNLIPEQLLRSFNPIIDQFDSKTYILRINADGIPIAVPKDSPIGVVGIILRLKKGAVESAALADTEAQLAGRITSLPTNEEATIKLNFVRKEPADGVPKVVSITKVEPSLFRPLGIQGPFEVKIVLTEQPKVFTPVYIDITNARIDWMYLGAPFGEDIRNPSRVEKPPIQEGNYAESEEIPDPSGRDGKYYPYFLTITPDLHNRDDIVIKVNAFEDRVKPPNRYIPPRLPVEGRERLTLKIHPAATITPLPKLPGFRVVLPHHDNASIPANGFYILTKDDEISGLDRPPALSHYNVRENSDLLDLEYFLTNGGTIDLVGPVDVPAGSVVISEVLWAQDWNLADGSESQWVEIYNTTGARLPVSENSWFLHFYKLGEPVPSPFTPGIIDRIGTLDRSRTPWPIFDKGQSGGVKIQPLISMERLIYTTKQAAEGTKASSWIASPRASHNVELTTSGRGIATPGFVNLSPLPKPVIPPPPEDTTIPIAGRRDIVISEIMYTVKRARLPQWIELHNRSSRSVNFKGWKVKIENDPEDETVLETDFTFTLKETLVGANQVVLLVTERGRDSGIGDDFDDFRQDRVIILKPMLNTTAIRYKLLSTNAFKVTLTPPSGTRPGDTAGNLGADPAWELPNAEGEERSSIIRNYRLKSDGMAADEWMIAPEQVFQHAQHDTYYGRNDDHGTPGYRAGNPLPVQLSSFHPEPTETGAIVIRWTTESELDNAGFNILRSTTRDGVFSLINPTLIPGAGTTGEKHTYTYTDTTAKSNVIYYYRIKDVSFAGMGRTLATVRLKGYISAADRLTTTWGHLKAED